MNQVEIRQIMEKLLLEATELNFKCESSKGDGVTTNGERNIMNAKIRCLSMSFFGFLELLSIDSNSNWSQFKFDTLTDFKIDLNDSNFLRKFLR